MEQEKSELNMQIRSLELSVETQAAQIRELTRLSHAINDQLNRKGTISGLFSSGSKPPPNDKDILPETPVKDVSENHDLPPGVVSDAVVSFLAPADEDHALRFVADSVPIVQKGIITEAVEYFLDGCREA